MTGTTSENIALSTSQLSVGYQIGTKQEVILEDINVSLRYGQLVCFMGQNGVGKSTVLRTITGVQAPLAGKVSIGGKGLAGLNVLERSKLISLVLTEKVNVGNLTGYELVVMGRYPYLGWNMRLTSEDRQIIDRAIDQTHVRPFIDKKLYQLSDGQLQKVMIARALAQDGDIMVLDEPTAHLDLNNRVEVINLLKSLSRETKKAILMATHELDLALQSADWLWLVQKQKPIVQGIPEDLILSGEMDKAFPLKGYDLKTGKMVPNKYRGKSISLIGKGHEYLWTKNALERDGFEVVNENNGLQISVLHQGGEVIWEIAASGTALKVQSIGELLLQLDKMP